MADTVGTAQGVASVVGGDLGWRFLFGFAGAGDSSAAGVTIAPPLSAVGTANGDSSATAAGEAVRESRGYLVAAAYAFGYSRVVLPALGNAVGEAYVDGRAEAFVAATGDALGEAFALGIGERLVTSVRCLRGTVEVTRPLAGELALC